MKKNRKKLIISLASLFGCGALAFGVSCFAYEPDTISNYNEAYLPELYNYNHNETWFIDKGLVAYGLQIDVAHLYQLKIIDFDVDTGYFETDLPGVDPSGGYVDLSVLFNSSCNYDLSDGLGSLVLYGFRRDTPQPDVLDNMGYFDYSIYNGVIAFCEDEQIVIDDFIIVPPGEETRTFTPSYALWYGKYYNNSNFTGSYNDGRNDGYNAGYNEGHEMGYNRGYYQGYNEGDTNGYIQGYDEGQTDGLIEGYNQGYNEGVASNFETNGFKTLLGSIFTYPVNVLKSMFNFEIMGINLFALISFVVSIGVVIFVINKFRK